MPDDHTVNDARNAALGVALVLLSDDDLAQMDAFMTWLEAAPREIARQIVAEEVARRQRVRLRVLAEQDRVQRESWDTPF